MLQLEQVLVLEQHTCSGAHYDIGLAFDGRNFKQTEHDTNADALTCAMARMQAGHISIADMFLCC